MLDRLFLPPLVMMCGMDFGCSRGSLADADPLDLNLIIFINVFFKHSIVLDSVTIFIGEWKLFEAESGTVGRR